MNGKGSQEVNDIKKYKFLFGEKIKKNNCGRITV